VVVCSVVVGVAAKTNKVYRYSRHKISSRV